MANLIKRKDFVVAMTIHEKMAWLVGSLFIYF